MSEVYPLLETQEGLWFAQRLDAMNPLFNTGQLVHIQGALNMALFEQAVNQTLLEAEALHLQFREKDNGEVEQLATRSDPVKLELIDLSQVSDPDQAARNAIDHDTYSPDDPTADTLAVEQLFVLGGDRYIWYRRVHHLLIDGYGMTLLNNRVSELYRELVEEKPAGSPLGSYASVVADDANYRQSSQRGKAAEFWQQYMAGVPEVVSLANGRAVSVSRFHRQSQLLPAVLLNSLRQRADSAGLPWPDLVTALTAAYCQRFIGEEEIVVGVPYMGRMGNDSARVPAMIMNVLPLRIHEPLPEQGADAFFKTVARDMFRARRHGRYRSEQLRRDLGLLGGHRRLHGPLINVMPFEKPVRLSGVETELEILSTGPVDDMTFTFRGDGESRLLLEIDANPALYSEADLQAHQRRLLSFIEACLQAGDAPLSSLPLATQEEQQKWIRSVNQTEQAVPDVSLPALMEQCFARYADRPALTFAAEVGGTVQTLSYAELEQRTRALAQQLQQQLQTDGAGKDQLVLVSLPRSLELVIALLAVVRAGAAYLPIDPAHPDERIARIVGSAKPCLALIAEDQRARLTAVSGMPEALAPEQWQHSPDESQGSLPEVDPANLAYVIYTSGSTGEPKGVMIEHRAIVNRLEWMRTQYAFNERDRVLQKTPATFDVSVWEFFLPFISGAELVVALPEAHKNPADIAALIRRFNISTLHFVPSMLNVFVAEPSAHGLAVQRVFCSGEELTQGLCERFHQTVSAELHNLYGPTEAAVDVSYWQTKPGDRRQPVPIGAPVWNTRLYVLDEQLRALPAGVTGELYLAGRQLARGYLGREDLTEERFIPDPFVSGERMYKTGDLARWVEDGVAEGGVVEYLGRSDHQVKIRGLRIELGEIETVLMASGLVEQVGVLVQEGSAGQKLIVAYPVPAESYDETKLLAFARSRLPDYMVPVALVTLPSLPVTSNGKLDRRALPQPEMISPQGRAPIGEIEIKLAALFSALLKLEDEISAESDFFALGGDSLLAVQLMQRIQVQFGMDPGLGALFENPVLAELASLIDAGHRETDNGLQPVIRLAQGNDNHVPLFVVHPAGGIAWCYRQLAALMSDERSVYGLQAPSLDQGQPLPESIDALAMTYVDHMLAICPDGPYHIMGWSVGGIIAQAMAVRLKQLGKPTGVIAMLDSYPSECWRAEAEPTAEEALGALLAIAGFIPEDYPELKTREQIVEFLRQSGSPLGALPPVVLDGVIRVVLDVNRLVRGHYHQFLDADLLHVCAALDHQDSELHPDLWKGYARQLDVVNVPFLHGQLTGPEASTQVADILLTRMKAVEQTTD